MIVHVAARPFLYYSCACLSHHERRQPEWWGECVSMQLHFEPGMHTAVSLPSHCSVFAFTLHFLTTFALYNYNYKAKKTTESTCSCVQLPACRIAPWNSKLSFQCLKSQVTLRKPRSNSFIIYWAFGRVLCMQGDVPPFDMQVFMSLLEVFVSVFVEYLCCVLSFWNPPFFGGLVILHTYTQMEIPLRM
jgi:hypothetical protein